MEQYKPLWEYIPVDQYKSPSAPAREVVRNGIVSFWERLHPASGLRTMSSQMLRSIPFYLLDRAAPIPDSACMVVALQMALRGWQNGREPEQNVQVVVGAPGSGLEQTVTELAKQQGWQLMGPPEPEQILAGGHAWLDKAKDNGLVPLVIPRLGKCFLRHQEGLILMSRLLDWLQTTKRRCLIACDSWAWTYLMKSLQIDVMLPKPLALAPFDGARLQFWLPALSQQIHKGRFIFRDTENGRRIFPMFDLYDAALNGGSAQKERYGDWVGVSYLLRQLAAHSRGLPGVVWELWRRCLQIGTDVNLDKLVQEQAATDKRYTFWVRPWAHLKLPQVPGEVGTDESLVLHAILLHGGASAPLLGSLLPLSDNEVRRILHACWEWGLVEKKCSQWHVTLLAYPNVRNFLAMEGYLVDKF
jgi:hypothetical protein